MRAKKGLLVALVAVGLIAITVSILPAARNSTSVCQRGCNSVEFDCKKECGTAKAVCLDDCKEFSGDAQAACNAACIATEEACKLTCASAKAECKAACPRGGEESPTEPEP